jgi:hypothetical protein
MMAQGKLAPNSTQPHRQPGHESQHGALLCLPAGPGGLREYLRAEAAQDGTNSAIHTLLHGTHGQKRGLDAVAAQPLAQPAKIRRVQHGAPGTQRTVVSSTQAMVGQPLVQAAATAQPLAQGAPALAPTPAVSPSEIDSKQIQQNFEVRSLI